MNFIFSFIKKNKELTVYNLILRAITVLHCNWILKAYDQSQYLFLELA